MLLSLNLLSCAQPLGAPTEPAVSLECRNPRPEICTQQYDPVCGLRDSGVRCVTEPCPATEWKTYSNACTACADQEVIGYRQGACADSEN